MPETLAPGFLIESRGSPHRLGAHVASVAFDRGGGLVAFGLGDGTVRLLTLADPAAAPVVHEAHEGASLSLVADVDAGAFLSGGDDGQLKRVTADAALTLAEWPGKWIEHVLAFPGKSGWRAASVGKLVHVLGSGADGKIQKSLAHPSTATGIATDAKGKKLAVSHYNGATVWFVAAKEDRPRLLDWKGSHIGVLVSPDGDCVVSAMQENALHGWRLSTAAHMRMSGYPSKTRSMGFTAKGRWLATGGAEAVVCWPFHGDGPMGKAPVELAGGDTAICSRVACHPQHEVVAAGYSDGMVVLAEIATTKVLPIGPPGNGAVSALGWSADGRWLAWGTESGFVALVDFSKAS